MAVSLNLITFSGGTVAPKTDGIIYDSAIGQCGVFYGCNVTANGNTVYVSSGYGMIRGRFFEMNDSSIPVTLSPSGTLIGRIYLRLDLSNTTEPLQLLVASGSTLPDLTQEEDANFTNGVWEMELATFEITTSAIENVAETYQTITDNASLISALQTAVNTLNSNLNTVNIESIQRVATTVTTGATGNIALPHDNTGKIFIVAPLAAGSNTCLRAWVAGGGNQWYLTAIDPNTGATQNNRSLSIRYLVVTIKNI